MTADMAFECLLVSQDPSVVNIMNKLLGDLAISTNVCPNSATAATFLSEGSTDLVIVDGQKEFTELLNHINHSRRKEKPTVVVVSELESPVIGTHSLLQKPITAESGKRSLQTAYANLLQDYRRHTRYALVSSLIAELNNSDRFIRITVVNIGEGGVGLNTEEHLVKGDVLSFPLLLPGAESPIHIEGRVLWAREYGAVGCEFTNISQADRARLSVWLENQCRIKKPLVEC